MKCPKCHYDNPEGAIFCGKWGAKQEMTCPQRDSSNPLDFNFCVKCGHDLTIPTEKPLKDLSFDEKLEKIQRYLPGGLTEKILAQRDKIEGERKQVTVLFCDMKGLTPLSEKLGCEKVYSIMDEVYELLIRKGKPFHDVERNSYGRTRPFQAQPLDDRREGSAESELGDQTDEQTDLYQPSRSCRKS